MEAPARLTETGQRILCIVWGFSWMFSAIFVLIGWISFATDAKGASWQFAAISTAYFVGASIGAWAGNYLQ